MKLTKTIVQALVDYEVEYDASHDQALDHVKKDIGRSGHYDTRGCGPYGCYGIRRKKITLPETDYAPTPDIHIQAGPMKLRPEAAETAVGMIQFCVERGMCMGMDEGLEDTGYKKPRPFRAELEDFLEQVNRLNCADYEV